MVERRESQGMADGCHPGILSRWDGIFTKDHARSHATEIGGWGVGREGG